MAEDKRVRRTKKLLRQALAELMQEKEFKNITVSDVVRRADINRGTFYAYYQDVFDLREKVENELIDNLRRLMNDLLPGPNAQTMRPAIERAVGYLEENHDLADSLMRDHSTGSFEGKLMALMEECSKKIKPPQSEDDYFAIWFVAAGCIGMMKKWVIEGRPSNRAAVIDHMDELLCSILHRA